MDGPINLFANLALTARDNWTPLPETAVQATPRSIDEAYDAQAILADLATRKGIGMAVGYKIGATTPVMQEYLGVSEPLYGRILDINMRDSGDAFVCEGSCPIGLECEIAFQFGQDIPQQDLDWTGASIQPYIARCAPAIEVVENRYGDFRQRPVETIIADDVFQRGFALGPWRSDWTELDLQGTEAQLLVDGAVVEEGRGAAVLGDPINAMVWMANAARRTGVKLGAGDIVLTGSMTPVHWLKEFPCVSSIKIGAVGDCALPINRVGS